MKRRIFLLALCALLLIQPVQAAEDPQYLALTFDDGPSGRFTRRLLDGLAEREVKATFFLCGYRIESYPAEAERIAAEGHEIGHHGYSHDSMCAMTRTQVGREISRTAQLLPAGCSPVLMRPPGGGCGDCVCAAAEDLELAVISWSLDPQDWATRDADKITAHVLKYAKDGDIILLHDMSDSSVNAALAIIDALQARGFQFVTVSELARIKGVELEPGKIYTNFP